MTNAAICLVQPGLDTNIVRRQRLNESLLAACEQQDVTALVAALWAGADPKFHDENGLTALHRCAISGNTEGVKILVARGSDPLARCQMGWTPDQWATDRGHHDLAAMLLARQHCDRKASAHAERAQAPVARPAQEHHLRLHRNAQAALHVVQKITAVERHLPSLRAAC